MIKVQNLSKFYNQNLGGEICVFEGLNFGVGSGEIFAIKGVSGAGKSTILSLLAGFDRPSGGEIEILGTAINTLSIKFMSEFRRKNIGFIFQNFNLLPEFSVLQNVLMPAVSIGAKRYENEAMVLLQKFDLAPKKDVLAKNLSGGERQRTAIARALLMNPALILADEPSANLDANLTNNLVQIFQDLQNEGKTIVVASHDPLITESGIISNFMELKKC